MTKFFAIYAIGLVLVFHNLSQVDGIKCKTCTKASKLEDCNEELTCPANIASCLKFTHFLDGKMKINKGCGIVEFEEGDYCMESKITAGSQKGPKTVCMCTGENCNSSFSIVKTDQRFLLSSMIGLLFLSFGFFKT